MKIMNRDYVPSPLVQGRGLKLYCESGSCGLEESPLVQGRGLKLVLPERLHEEFKVAPRAGAWIETLV